MNMYDIARLAFKKHLSISNLDHYTGIVTLHAAATAAVENQDTELLEQVVNILNPFLMRQRSYQCSYKNYLCGGNGAAMLLMLGYITDKTGYIKECADQLLNEAQREPETGIFSKINRGLRHIWIDSIFAVTPFLLYCGIHFNEDKYIEEAYLQTVKMLDIFRDTQAHGTMHQCRGVSGPGELSADHWSRGNGWGLYGMTELIKFIPENDSRRENVVNVFRDFLLGCLSYQDMNGLWHQEITDHSSYVETSGSGLMLYALGVAIEKGILGGDYIGNLRKGLTSYMSYITHDGSIFNTCCGCLCPGDGSIETYIKQPWKKNDEHAFGPTIFAFSQASKMKIKSLDL